MTTSSISLPCELAGLAVAVQNARHEVKQEAHYVTPHAGGEGALRDAVEFILKAQGKWKKVVEAYIRRTQPHCSKMRTAEDAGTQRIKKRQNSLRVLSVLCGFGWFG